MAWTAIYGSGGDTWLRQHSIGKSSMKTTDREVLKAAATAARMLDRRPIDGLCVDGATGY